MRKTNRFAVLGVAVAALSMFAAPKASDASVVLTLEPEGGVNLSALTVGETFKLDVVYSQGTPSRTDEVVERHFGKPEGSFSNLSLLSFTDNPALTSTYLTPSGIVGEVATFQATAPGSGSVFADFTYNDSYNVLGYVETNYLSSYFIDSNTLNFNVLGASVPEPTSIGLVGMAGVGLLARRRRRSTATA